jgi:hypothetical protein
MASWWQAIRTVAIAAMLISLSPIWFQFLVSLDNPASFWMLLTLDWKFWCAAAAIAVIAMAITIGLIWYLAVRWMKSRPGLWRPQNIRLAGRLACLGARTFMALTLLLMTFLGLLLGAYGSVRDATLLVSFLFYLAIIPATANHIVALLEAMRDGRECEKCGYLLIGLREPRCPECGTAFDPARLPDLAVPPGPSSSAP